MINSSKSFNISWFDLTNPYFTKVSYFISSKLSCKGGSSKCFYFVLKGSTLVYYSQNKSNTHEAAHTLPSARIGSPLNTTYTNSPRTDTGILKPSVQEINVKSPEYQLKEGECFGEIVSNDFSSK